MKTLAHGRAAATLINSGRYLVAILALMVAVGLTAHGALAGKLTDTTAGRLGTSPAVPALPPGSKVESSLAGVPGGKSAQPSSEDDGYMTLEGSTDTFG